MNKIFDMKYWGSFLLICVLILIGSANASAQQKTEKVFVKIEVKGLACPFCAYGMEKDLRKLAGVDHVDIELKEGLAYITVPEDQKPTKEEIEDVIIAGGFTPGAIVFSTEPFVREKQ